MSFASTLRVCHQTVCRINGRVALHGHVVATCLPRYRLLSTERPDADILRKHNAITNKFRIYEDISREYGTFKGPILEAGERLQLEFELRNPLLAKYGVNKRDMMEGASTTIKKFFALTGAKGFIEQETESVAQLTRLVSPTILQKECHSAHLRKALGFGRVQSSVDIDNLELTFLRTEIVPKYRRVSYYVWSAVERIIAAKDTFEKALCARYCA
jgi:hypothetical protein